jgi:hypothetical protein
VRATLSSNVAVFVPRTAAVGVADVMIKTDGDMVKRTQHIRTFLHNERGLYGKDFLDVWLIVNPASENLCLKVYRPRHQCNYIIVQRLEGVWAQNTGNVPVTAIVTRFSAKSWLFD